MIVVSGSADRRWLSSHFLWYCSHSALLSEQHLVWSNFHRKIRRPLFFQLSRPKKKSNSKNEYYDVITNNHIDLFTIALISPGLAFWPPMILPSLNSELRTSSNESVGEPKIAGTSSNKLIRKSSRKEFNFEFKRKSNMKMF